ncbi:hypothetical protein ACN4EE_18550 [Geminocystis sp. CENA526]|uniref:hypothetical protein n=1 Tax=Geminocystis sp. CENA526 TaxID=1355871 RepID=UPI003D6F7E2F
MVNYQTIAKVREKVTEICSEKHFIHHKWYIEYHLNIVEKISLQLCERYFEADQLWVLLLVWMHDFEKIVRNGSIYQGTLGKEFLEDLDFFPEDIAFIKIVRYTYFLIIMGFSLFYVPHKYKNCYISKLLLDIDIFERKTDIKLVDAKIEIKIVSSADAAAHLIGPFYSIFWWENPNMSIENLRKSNGDKLEKDWNKKVVLPEIRDTYGNHYQFFKKNFEMTIPSIN